MERDAVPVGGRVRRHDRHRRRQCRTRRPRLARLRQAFGQPEARRLHAERQLARRPLDRIRRLDLCEGRVRCAHERPEPVRKRERPDQGQHHPGQRRLRLRRGRRIAPRPVRRTPVLRPRHPDGPDRRRVAGSRSCRRCEVDRRRRRGSLVDAVLGQLAGSRPGGRGRRRLQPVVAGDRRGRLPLQLGLDRRRLALSQGRLRRRSVRPRRRAHRAVHRRVVPLPTGISGGRRSDVRRFRRRSG